LLYDGAVLEYGYEIDVIVDRRSSDAFIGGAGSRGNRSLSLPGPTLSAKFTFIRHP